MRPIADDLAAAGAKTLIYAPDDQLRYVPLAAVHDGERWLIENFRVNNITATSLADLTTLPSDGLPAVLAAAYAEGNHQVEVRDRTSTPPHPVHVRDRLQITVTSHETVPLHLAIIAVTPSGNLVLLHPANPATEVILAPEQTVLFPDPADRNDLQPLETGTHEALVLASRRPFTRMLKGLDAVINGSRLPGEPDPSEDLSGLNGLLEGFDTPRGEADASAVTVLGVDEIAALSLTVEALG
ncbi:MAG: DUF4384 domain-containing protein [Cyanobacteria bacterium P01_D01_bin.14]